MIQTKTFLKIFVFALILGIVFAGCVERPSADEDGTPSNSFTALTVGKWTSGEIRKLNSGKVDEQWFKFVATASTQRVYVKLSTLSDLKAYLYDSNSDRIGSDLSVNGSSGKIGYIEYSLNIGATYYIKVTGYNSNYTGTYWIGFTAFPAQPETVITTLSENTWAYGNIVTTSSGGTGEQWFKFTATVSTQYVYFRLSSLTDLYAYVYDSNYYQVGDRVNIDGNSGTVKNLSRMLTAGLTYYIKITGYNSNNNYGTYWIGFTSFPAAPETSITVLTENAWKEGLITQVNNGGTGEQWFSFTATAASQYLFVKLSSLKDLYVYVIDSNYNSIGNKVNLYGNEGAVKNTLKTLVIGETYYIQITGYNSGGTYWITFNSTGTAPN